MRVTVNKLLLGINIDHVATLRNARGTTYPDPIHAALIAEQAGVDNITIHLREDRRHITDRDIHILRQVLGIRMNLEMAMTEEMLAIACDVQPHSCCLVPENRQEITTERGLDIITRNHEEIRTFCSHLANAGIRVSLFVDPNFEQIKEAANIGVPYIEIHTGYYANEKNEKNRMQELNYIAKAASYAASLGLKVNAGHGLNYHNVQSISALPEIRELNIGHSIICRAVMTGLKEAISTMKYLISESRK